MDDGRWELGKSSSKWDNLKGEILILQSIGHFQDSKYRDPIANKIAKYFAHRSIFCPLSSLFLNVKSIIDVINEL
jgi:hypothetical protein